jgi:hypothetical protein
VIRNIYLYYYIKISEMLDNRSKLVLFRLVLLVGTIFQALVYGSANDTTSPGVSMSLELSLINQFKNTHMNTII